MERCLSPTGLMLAHIQKSDNSPKPTQTPGLGQGWGAHFDKFEKYCLVFKFNASVKNQMPEYIKIKYCPPGFKKNGGLGRSSKGEEKTGQTHGLTKSGIFPVSL